MIYTKQISDFSEGVLQTIGNVQDDPTGFENRTDSKISIAGATFTVEPTVAEFSYYIKGVKYTKTAANNVTLPNTEGLHFIYFKGTTLSSTTTYSYTLIIDYALVAIVYWDSTNSLSQLFDERHGHKMPSSVHLWLHTNAHAQYQVGMQPADFIIGNGSLNSHAQFTITEGTLTDEDITLTTPAITLSGADKDIYYFDTGGNVRWFSNQSAPVRTTDGTSVTRLPYNDPITGGLSEVGNGNYVLCHVIALNNGKYGFFVGQQEYTNTADARAGILTEAADLYHGKLAVLTPEFVLVASIIYETKSTLVNDYNARIIEVESGVNYYDWRTASITGTGGVSVNDHELLTNLLGGGTIGHYHSDQPINIADFPKWQGIELDTTYTVTGAETTGSMYWDSDNRCVSIVYNDSIIQLGQEQYFTVKNETGSILTNGMPIQFAGTNGMSGHLLAEPAEADPSSTPEYFMGIVTHDIATGEFGEVTRFGKVRGISTDGSSSYGGAETWISGTLLYVDPLHPGYLTNVKPNAPNRIITVCVVVSAHASNGTIFVRPTWNARLESLANVNGTVAQNNYALLYNETNEYWDPAPITSDVISPEGGLPGQLLSIAPGSPNTVIWRSVTPYLMAYNNTAWGISYVGDMLDDIADNIEHTSPSGKLSDTILYQTSLNSLRVLAGSGYITYENYHRKISWSQTDIIFAGSPAEAEGLYYVYVDTTGTVLYSSIEPSYINNIVLGTFYSGGSNIIALVINDGSAVDDFGYRLTTALKRLGGFIWDDGCRVAAYGSPQYGIVSTLGKIQYGTQSYDVTEVSSSDAGTRFFNYLKSADFDWYTNYAFIYDCGGFLCPLTYNDVTGKCEVIASSDCTFTNGSTTVSTATDLTSEIDPGNHVYLASDSDIYMSHVLAIDASSITLRFPYRGSSATGTTIINKSIVEIPDGKWVKGVVARTLNNQMQWVMPQGYYDTQIEAEDAGLPETPPAIESAAIKLATVIYQKNGELIFKDIRPLPFALREGGSQSGTVLSSHTDLTGLDRDDHIQYLLADGSRKLNGILSYLSHPTFSADTQVINKKYVDDLILTVPLLAGRLGDILNINNISELTVGAGVTFNENINVTNQIKIGNLTGAAAAGMVRYNGTNFQGYHGGSWVNLDTQGASPLTTKGDIYVYSVDNTRLGVGTNGQVLSADSTAITGLKWIDPPAVGRVFTDGAVQTTDATETLLDTIDDIPDDDTTVIEVFIKAFQSSATNYGVWKRTLVVTKVSGTPTIQLESADVDKTSASLNANSIDFTVSGGDVLINVTGIAATTIDWTSKYEII